MVIGILIASLLAGDIVLAAQENDAMGVPFRQIWEEIGDIQEEQKDIKDEQKVVQADLDKLWNAMDLIRLGRVQLFTVVDDEWAYAEETKTDLDGMSISFEIAEPVDIIVMFTAKVWTDISIDYSIVLNTRELRRYRVSGLIGNELVHIHTMETYYPVGLRTVTVKMQHQAPGLDDYPDLFARTTERELTVMVFPAEPTID